MNSDISYDPVSVIDEKEAIGETAKIFKDIRETMNIPLITSIWRGLAEIDDSLKKIWTIARPIYETQNPEKKLKEIIKYYVGLGISVKNSYALNDFYNSRKPENTIMSLGVDATHSFFKQNKYLDPFKEIIVKNIKNNEILKKFSKIISNRGLSL